MLSKGEGEGRLATEGDGEGKLNKEEKWIGDREER